jgi:uncharacterized coiled-coil protein SlyX
MLHKETMKQDTTCPTCGLYWTREDNEDCPRCDTCNRLRIEQLEGQLSEAKAEIARLSADLEAASKVVEATRGLLDAVQGEFSHYSVAVQIHYALTATAFDDYAAYRSSPDSNTSREKNT